MNYLITGATGGFGNYAMEYLKQLVPQENIYVLARNEEKGKHLKKRVGMSVSEIMLIILL